MRILAIIGAVLLGALLIFVGALGARWLVPTDAGSPPAAIPAAVKPERAPAPFDLETLRGLLAVVDAGRRNEILGSAENFAEFVHQETLNQAVLKAAYANDADRNDQIRVLMERAGQRVLVEVYLNQIVRVNLDPKFPSEEQVKEAYDKNPDAFRVPERMHLWQIFIPLEAGASDAEVKSAWQLAERIAGDLRSGKADFATLAKKHSVHEASRVNDGYMGLIKVADLLPAIAEAANKLEVGEISEPIASETGLHVIRRGATVAEEMLEFDRVKDQLRRRLQQEAALKVRRAAVEKVEAEFPVAAPTSDLESWRKDLLQKRGAGVGEAPAQTEP